MKKTMRSLLSLVLCLSLCMSMAVPAMAANENNTQGVTFSVSLDNSSIAANGADQVVTMTLVASQPVTLDGIAFTVTQEAPLTLTSVSENIDNFTLDTLGSNFEIGQVYMVSDNQENVSGVTELAVITFTVPADTQSGTYQVGVKDMEVTADYGDVWENTATASTTLTITDSPSEEPEEPEEPEVTGYSAGLSSTTPTATTGDKVYVSVAVNHVSETSFNAGELVFAYDAAYLAFNQADSTLGNATVKDNAGTLTLEDYGVSKACGNGIYILAFDATADGAATVELTSAKFSNQENAASSDLVAGVAYPASVDVSISKKTFNVTLPEGLSGAETVTDGESYTFAVADENYTYTEVSATVDGVGVDVTDNGDGTYTVGAVTGDLKITVTRTPKSYTVTFEGNAAEDITDGADTAVYGSNYTFTMPASDDWAYSLESITIGGTAYTGYSVADNVYTIPGTAINGNIVITVSKVEIITSVAVSVTGSGAGAAAGYATVAELGAPYTLTIVPEDGYSYTVTATMGGEAVELIIDGNSYTIENVTDAIVFTVERAVVVSGVTVSEFISIDGNKVWLIKNVVTLAEGKVPTYEGSNMFWSEEYDAYCCLVITETLNEEVAQAAIGIADGVAVTIDYGMDVNKTGVIDANDAQLTYNIYNAYYNAFDDVVTMEKFLRADVNVDGVVNTADAAAIINKILNG